MLNFGGDSVIFARLGDCAQKIIDYDQKYNKTFWAVMWRIGRRFSRSSATAVATNWR